MQGDQGREEKEEEEQSRREPKEQGFKNDNNREVNDGDVLVRVRYRGETRLLRPRGGKLELDSLQDENLPENLPDSL